MNLTEIEDIKSLLLAKASEVYGAYLLNLEYEYSQMNRHMHRPNPLAAAQLAYSSFEREIKAFGALIDSNEEQADMLNIFNTSLTETQYPEHSQEAFEAGFQGRLNGYFSKFAAEAQQVIQRIQEKARTIYQAHSVSTINPVKTFPLDLNEAIKCSERVKQAEAIQLKESFTAPDLNHRICQSFLLSMEPFFILDRATKAQIMSIFETLLYENPPSHEFGLSLFNQTQAERNEIFSAAFNFKMQDTFSLVMQAEVEALHTSPLSLTASRPITISPKSPFSPKIPLDFDSASFAPKSYLMIGGTP